MTDPDHGAEDRSGPDPPDRPPPGDEEPHDPAEDLPDEARIGGVVDPRLTEAE
jgi:hypothetical protein